MSVQWFKAMRISPTEERAWDIIMSPVLATEAEVALQGLTDVVEQAKDDGATGWVMPPADLPPPRPIADEVWPVRAEHSFGA